MAGAVAEGQVLERALAALVADRAVERVVDEDELERRVLALGRLRRGLRGPDDHPVLRGQRAAGLELRHALDLDEAHAAGADGRAEPRLVAEDRDLDPAAAPPRRARCPSDLDLAAVDGDLDELDLDALTVTLRRSAPLRAPIPAISSNGVETSLTPCLTL